MYIITAPLFPVCLERWFQQSPSFRKAQRALIGQLTWYIVIGQTLKACVGNVVLSHVLLCKMCCTQANFWIAKVSLCSGTALWINLQWFLIPSFFRRPNEGILLLHINIQHLHDSLNHLSLWMSVGGHHANISHFQKTLWRRHCSSSYDTSNCETWWSGMCYYFFKLFIFVNLYLTTISLFFSFSL